MLKVIADARKIVSAKDVSDETLLAWIAQESSWRPEASAYGNTGARSTAVGLLQVLKSTYESPDMAAGRPSQLPKTWDEKALTDPVLNVAAGLHILQVKREQEKMRGGAPTVGAGLKGFRGDTQAANNEAYLASILAGEAAIKTYVAAQKGAPNKPAPSLQDLSPVQQAQLLGDLYRALGR